MTYVNSTEIQDDRVSLSAVSVHKVNAAMDNNS